MWTKRATGMRDEPFLVSRPNYDSLTLIRGRESSSRPPTKRFYSSLSAGKANVINIQLSRWIQSVHKPKMVLTTKNTSILDQRPCTILCLSLRPQTSRGDMGPGNTQGLKRATCEKRGPSTSNKWPSCDSNY